MFTIFYISFYKSNKLQSIKFHKNNLSELLLVHYYNHLINNNHVNERVAHLDMQIDYLITV